MRPNKRSNEIFHTIHFIHQKISCQMKRTLDLCSTDDFKVNYKQSERVSDGVKCISSIGRPHPYNCIYISQKFEAGKIFLNVFESHMLQYCEIIL